MPNRITSRFFAQARRHPERTAIHYRDGRVSYQDLAERVMRIADGLATMAGPGPVAARMGRTPDLVTVLLAVWQSGHAFVALDPRHPMERQRQILQDSRPGLLVHDREGSGEGLVTTKAVSYETLQGTRPPAGWQSGSRMGAEDPAYLLFTSGSTGRPKGIAIANRGVEALVDWSSEYFSREELECVLASTTITFDLSVFEIFVPLSLGKSLFLVDSILDLVEPKYDFTPVTFINTVPSAVRAILRAGAIPARARTLCLAGEALHWELVNSVYERSPVNQIYNLWGPSEDTTYSTAWRCPDRSMPRPMSGAVPIGTAISGTQVLVLDPALAPVAPGEEGELCLAGEGLALGYCDNPELTAERFPSMRSPDGRHHRIYRTGDRGRLDADGVAHFLGRMDLQVKIRGHRVELEEIEQCLLAVPAIGEAAAILIDRPEGAALTVVVVSLDRNESEAATIARCRSHLADLLPDYMQPQRWVVHAGSLPRTTSGKLDRQGLREGCLRESTADKRLDDHGFLGLVAQVLGPVDDLERSFLESGGDSLSAVHLLTLTLARWEGALTLGRILDPAQSLRRLAQWVESQPLRWKQNAGTPRVTEHLSPIEQRMWKVYRSHRHPDAYNIGIILHLAGPVDADRLNAALAGAARSSRALAKRIVFVEGATCFQETALPPSPAILQGPPVAGLMESLCDVPFDLEREIPFRYRLVKNGAAEAWLFLCFAHTAVDGYGLRAWMAELCARYQGLPAPSPRVDVPAGQGPTLQEATEFWRARLGGLTDLGFPPPPLSPQPDGVQTFTIPASDWEDMSGRADRLGCTLPVYLLATLGLALQRLGCGEELVIGCPVANRAHPDDINLVANLTNTLPMRCHPQEGLSCAAFLEQIHHEVAEILTFQATSIDQVLDALGDAKIPARLLGIIFSHMDFLRGLPSLPACQATADFHQPRHAKAPLVFSAIVTAEGALRMVFEFQGDQVSADWVKTLAELFQHLLAIRAATSGQPIGSLPTLPPRQEPVLRKLCQATPLTQPRPNLVTWLEATASQYSGRTAIVDHDLIITYQDLWAESERLAAGLQTQGVGRGDVVGICMGRSWRMVVALVGILRAGACYVPLDPRNPAERNRSIADKSRIQLTIAEETGEWPFPCLPYPQLAQCAEAFVRPTLDADDPAYVIFTSGTTGAPKGVPITHRNVTRLFQACAAWADFVPSDVWSLLHSHAFDFSVWEIFGALLHGARLVVIPSHQVGDMASVTRLLERHRVTVLSMTPTAFRNFLSAHDRLSHRPRMIIFGGEALWPDDLAAWWARYDGQGTRLINMFGITEITVHGTWHEMTPDTVGSCIGRPLEDLGAALVDARGNLCPMGVPGEIWVAGDGVSQGYLHDPELTDARFCSREWLGMEPQRYYRSGDLGVLGHDGLLYHLGRLDHQVKINGHRIELDEITGLARQVQGIEHCLPRAVNVEGSSRMLVLYYVASIDPGPEAILDHLRARLPTYALPARTIRIAELPTTGNGKIAWDLLPDPILAPIAEPQQRGSASPVRTAWMRLIGADPGLDQRPFFELGGDSLKAALLVRMVNEMAGRPCFSLVDVFRFPTLPEQEHVLSVRLQEG